AQLAAWLTPLNERKAKVLHAYRLIEGAYVCYDTPKKFPMIVVRRVLARLLSEAGLKSSSGKMSDYIKANYFCIQARVNNKRPWECLSNYPVPQLGGIWFPTPRIQLSADAGPLLRKLMLKRREADFQVPPMRRACDELARLVAYKLNFKLDLPLKQWLREGRSGDELVQAIEEAPIFRRRGVGSLSYLAGLAL
ncbi:pif1, partial [Symbiodinium sp. KB8]